MLMSLLYNFAILPLLQQLQGTGTHIGMSWHTFSPRSKEVINTIERKIP